MDIQQIEQLEVRLQEMANEVAALRIQLATERECFQKEIEEAEARKAEAEKARVEAEEERAKAEKAIAELQDMAKEKYSEIARLQAEAAALMAQAEALRAEILNTDQPIETKRVEEEPIQKEIIAEKPTLQEELTISQNEDREEDEEEKKVVFKGDVSLGSSIPSIRKAISIGDRFLFQRELFAGNGEQMNKTIDHLDALSSLEEAEVYIDKNFKWDKDSNAYTLFHNLMLRRW